MAQLGDDQETSFGVIPVKFCEDQTQLLLVQHRQGHWSFPKGRIEPEEDPKQCAVRELFEETGLRVVRFLSDRSFTEHYSLVRDGLPKQKSVTYFVAEVVGEATPQLLELRACHWVSLAEARDMITFSEARSLLASVIESGILH